jgi:hypothetical protein
VGATLVALAASALLVQSVPAARLDRGPRIRAVRAKADAFVTATKRTTNFGRTQELRVDGAPRTRAYLRFNVDLQSGDVEHVSILLWSRTRAHAGYQVRLVEDRWRERSITFANAPMLSPDYVTSGRLKAGAWKAVDVTPLTDMLSGEDDYVSLALTTMSPKGVEFASRESGLHGPRLIVERSGRDGGGDEEPELPDG